MRFTLLALALFACTKQEIPKPKPPPPQLEHLELLTGGARTGDRVPIIVALHGLGDRPESFARVFSSYPEPARFIVPRAPDPDGFGGFRWFESRTRDGDVPRISRQIRAAARAVDRLLLALHERHGVRPIVTGFSQGGMLSFGIAAAHPERIAAAIPISGWLPPPLWPAAKPRSAPIVRALHGTGDSIVPFDLDRQTCDRLAALGFDVELIPFTGVDHTVTPEMHRRWFELIEALAPDPVEVHTGDGRAQPPNPPR